MTDGANTDFPGPGENPTPDDVVPDDPGEFANHIVDPDGRPVVAVAITGLRENPNIVGASVHAIRDALPDGYELRGTDD